MTKTVKHTQTNFDSNGAVYRPPRHGVGLWGNPRVPMTVRVDAKLKKRAKTYLIAKFGSTCRGIEVILAALLKANDIQQDVAVYRQPTTSINFEKVVIERNIRTRRKMVVEEEVVEKVVEVAKCFVCGGVAVGEAVYQSGKQVLVCKKHLIELSKHPKWRVLMSA